MGRAWAVLALILGGVVVAFATVPSLRKPSIPAGPKDVTGSGLANVPEIPPAPSSDGLSTMPFVKKVLDLLDPLFPKVEPPPLGFTEADNMTQQKLPPLVAALCNKWSTAYSLNPAITQAQCWQESHGNQDARSSRGAIGLMQLMPATAQDLGVNPYDASDNVKGGCLYMRRLLNKYNQDYSLALAAYNAGPGNVDHYKGIPPFAETENYVAVILENAGVSA